MKSIIFLILASFITSYSQEISVSRDTMSIGNTNYTDSVTIYNNGTNPLIIDSIQCKNTNYILNISPSSDSTKWTYLEEYFHSTNIAKIQPDDSLKVRISIAAIIVKESKINHDEIDTMYFYNNSTNSPSLPIVITNKVTMGVVEKDKAPVNYKLSQNYPNPFNPSTIISFSLNRASIVVLKVYNNLGQEIKEIIRGFRNVGEYKIEFNGKELPSGVYYYRLSVGLSSTTKKMLLLK